MPQSEPNSILGRPPLPSPSYMLSQAKTGTPPKATGALAKPKHNSPLPAEPWREKKVAPTVL